MNNVKSPRTFLTGCTAANIGGITEYLRYTGQMEFADSFDAHPNKAEALVSLYAKMCYKSLVLGKNANVTRVRDIEDNLHGVLESGHGSVFEHVCLNFITTDCSRVFTHELVRHRVGTAFSQTSGRYVSIDDVDLVLPPDLTCGYCWKCGGIDSSMCDVCNGIGSVAEAVEETRQHIVDGLRRLRRMLVREDATFTEKKKLTSAIRRLAPNGQTNEIGWSMNIRSLRHTIEMRTGRHAEWEIRLVFNQVADLVRDKWPTILHGAKTEMVDGMAEYTGLRV